MLTSGCTTLSLLLAVGTACASVGCSQGVVGGSNGTSGTLVQGPGGTTTSGSATGGAASGVASDAGMVLPALSAPPALGMSAFTAACTPGVVNVAWSPIRRISRVEYNNMVRDLLGDTTQPANAFPPESPLGLGVNFQSNTYAGVSALVAQSYLQGAEALAQTAVSNSNTLQHILPCQTQDDACAKQFISAWANTALRGQLDSTEAASLFQLYSDVHTQFDFATGIEAVIAAVLESPRFLYVTELGSGTPSAGAMALAPYEVAARLALFLWRSVPDAALMAAAANNQLSTADEVQGQATRMLADPKAKGALDDFTTQWMQLQATATLGKDTPFSFWNGDSKLGAELADETRTNVSQAVQGAGSLIDLLTSPASYINGDLARFYGNGPGNTAIQMGTGPSVTVNDPMIGDTMFIQTSLPNRAGLLTNGAVLATQAHTALPSSVLRGKLVREQILCDPIPPPPPNIPPPAATVGDAGTTRALLEEHFNKEPCVSCHQYMDPIGLGFGFFDATGAYQPNDANGIQNVPSGGFPAIDATGQVLASAPGEFTATFDGAQDLVTKLAGAEQTHQCFALQEFRYALGRLEGTGDVCSLQQAYGTFSSGNLSIQKLLVALTGTDAFRYRSAQNPAGQCQ